MDLGFPLLLLLVLQLCRAEDEYHRRLRKPHRRLAAVNPQETSPEYWATEARTGIEARSAEGARARNVVMFLGDGMSVTTLAAARTLRGQRAGSTGEEAQLFFEAFPTVGLAKTYCVDSQIADSACTASAYLCGAKANLGTIGVTAAVPRWDCPTSANTDFHLDSVAAWALADGRDAGIVTTTRVTHASPAGTFARVADRDWESDEAVRAAGYEPSLCPDIAHQLVHHHPGNQFKVILGGGRREFIPKDMVDEEGTAGLRGAGHDLIEEWRADKLSRNVSHRFVWNREQLLAAGDDLPDYLLGLFEGSHMQYHMQADPTTEPTLAEMTEIAIRSLSRNGKGFFLFVEGGRIDHAHHENMVELALDETIELSSAVQRASELLSPEDSLIVVTSDHAHVMSFNGYTQHGGDVLGPSDDLGDDGVPYMTLSYANGPGHRPHLDDRRQDVTADHDYRSVEWRSHAEVPLQSETHGGEDVGVFARGPHYGLFAGLYEQSRLPHLMACAAAAARRPVARPADLPYLIILRQHHSTLIDLNIILV